MKYSSLKNMGVIDRILRFVGLHLIISLVDATLINNEIGMTILTAIGLYLIITAILGIDPIYRLIDINTDEIVSNNNLKA